LAAKTAAMKSRTQSSPVIPPASTQDARGNALAAVEPHANAAAPAPPAAKRTSPDTKTQIGPSDRCASRQSNAAAPASGSGANIGGRIQRSQM
jgi:hypothetical protein